MQDLGMPCGNGDGIEQAEAHRMGGFGMMTGRPHRAKSVAGFSRHHGIDRRGDSADRPQCRGAGAGRKNGVGVQCRMTRNRNGGQGGADKRWLVHQGNVGFAAQWRFHPQDSREVRLLESLQYRGQASGCFGMAAAGIVRDTILVCHQQGRHCGIIVRAFHAATLLVLPPIKCGGWLVLAGIFAISPVFSPGFSRLGPSAPAARWPCQTYR